jgi:hypothetical protein
LAACALLVSSCDEQSQRRDEADQETRVLPALLMLTPQDDQPVAYAWDAGNHALVLQPANGKTAVRIKQLYSSTKSEYQCNGILYDAIIRVGTAPIRKGSSGVPSKLYYIYDVLRAKLSSADRSELRSRLHQVDISGATICAASAAKPDFAQTIGDSFVTGSRMR